MHGSQELEIVDDVVKIKLSSLLKGNKESEIELAMLNPEPVIDGSMLHFHSRVKCGPLISLYLNKPNPDEFNAFVNSVKDKANNEFNAFAGLKS